MTSSAERVEARSTGAWGRFDLPRAEGRALLRRQAAWAVAQGGAGVALALVGFGPDTALGLGLATGFGAVAARPARAHLLPVVLAAVVVVTVGLTRVGAPVAVAAGLGAGLVVGGSGALERVEAALAGITGAGVGAWLGGELAAQLALGGAAATLALSLATGTLAGLLTAQALLPGALAFLAGRRLPSLATIRATLAEPYRPPCARAAELDADLRRAAPDDEARDGMSEVAGWVYRLARTLQQLDTDVARIDPDALRARIEALGTEPTDDLFVRERREVTAGHLARQLDHRAVLQAERHRVAALQEYALAWLEEARAGLAVARVHPGVEPPERLDAVLQRLRTHAAERDAHRSAGREVDRTAPG